MTNCQPSEQPAFYPEEEIQDERLLLGYGQFIKCTHAFLVPRSELSAQRGGGDGGDLSAEFEGVSLNKELFLD